MEKIIQGDCLDVLKELPDNSVDAVVTDPPYGLSKEPDIYEVLTKWMNGEDYHHRGGGFMGASWDSFVPGPSIWREVYRVLKPGGHALVFAGTRTQDLMTTALRLAGFEVRDVIEWLYFSGFPKNHDVSKAFNKRAGAEREVIGKKIYADGKGRTSGKIMSLSGENLRPYQMQEGDWKERLETAPATELARKWDGWGTALKPSHEPIIYAHKPFNSVPISGIMKETTSLLEVALCLLLSSVNGAEKILKLSPPVQNAESDFAVMSAALLHMERSGELKELMVTFNSPETVLTCLNIVTLWSSILEESLKNGNMFTTKTETNLITALKTLNSLLSPITQESTIRGVMTAYGFGSNANNAEKNLNDGGKNTSDTLKRFVAVSATLRTGENGTPANIAANALRLIIPSVVSVLKDVQTEIRMNNDAKSPFDPAHEPIILARKPLEGTVCDNVEKWGCGALNIDGCRIPTDDKLSGGAVNGSTSHTDGWDRPWKHNKEALQAHAKRVRENVEKAERLGRFPANCVTLEEDQFYSKYFNITPPELSKKASKKDRNSDWKGEPIDLPEHRAGGLRGRNDGSLGKVTYNRNHHPTVKPIMLMSWLIKLICPPGGIVLDPFAGSGSSLVAAKREGFGFIGIEKEAEYIEIAKARVGA